jgi:branched-chain amino acid aminotransferase
MKVWIDGVVCDGEEARIPVTDHGFLYGDGVFEGLRVYAGRIFRLDGHLRRLSVAARAIALEPPGGSDALREIVLETVRAHGTPDAYVRLILSRGSGPLGVDPTSCPRPRVVCMVDQVALYPADKVASGIDLVTSSHRRAPADVLDPRVKSLNYLTSALAKLEARQRSADDALLLNGLGGVAEATVANVFVARHGELLTPPATDGALEGITRATVLELAAGLALPARECSLGRFDFFAADEAFLTGTGAGIVPIRSLDGRPVGCAAPGPVTEKIAAAFADATRALGTPIEAPGFAPRSRVG